MIVIVIAMTRHWHCQDRENAAVAAQADMRKTLEEYKKRETAVASSLDSRDSELLEFKSRAEAAEAEAEELRDSWREGLAKLSSAETMAAAARQREMQLKEESEQLSHKAMGAEAQLSELAADLHRVEESLRLEEQARAMLAQQVREAQCAARRAEAELELEREHLKRAQLEMDRGAQAAASRAAAADEARLPLAGAAQESAEQLRQLEAECARWRQQVALVRKEAAESHSCAERARCEADESKRIAEEALRRLEDKAAGAAEQLGVERHRADDLTHRLSEVQAELDEAQLALSSQASAAAQAANEIETMEEKLRVQAQRVAHQKQMVHEQHEKLCREHESQTSGMLRAS